MKTKNTDIITKNKNILWIALATALILSIPLIAMQFTSDVNWDLTDFVIIGTLMIGTGLIYELVAKRLKNPQHRIIFGLVLLAALVLIWIELAVGILGTPFSGS